MPAPVQPTPLALFWRPHDSVSAKVRVWRSDWSGDQFEVMPWAEFEEVGLAFKRFGILIHEAGEDD